MSTPEEALAGAIKVRVRVRRVRQVRTENLAERSACHQRRARRRADQLPGKKFTDSWHRGERDLRRHLRP